MVKKKLFVVLSTFSVLAFSTGYASASAVKPTLSQTADSSIGAAEVMFAQIMIPHHEQATQMSKLALTNSSNRKVLSLARNIIKAQTREIVSMNRWLKAAGAEAVPGMDMGMHGMKGVMTDQQLTDLGKLKGSKFDRLFLSQMIIHHQGALKSVSAIANSRNTEAKALARSIKSTQSAEISVMKSMLASIK